MTGTAAERPRLLVVDGMGGPSPADYLPALTALAEVRILWVPPPYAEQAQDKRRAMAGYAAVEVDRPDDLPDAAVRLARSWRPDGMFAQTETVLYDAAVAAERIGVRFHSEPTAARLVRKDLQREALREAGVPGPRVAVLRPGSDLRSAVAEVGLPAVLKPVTGVGSAVTMLIESPEQLADAYLEATRHYSANPRMYGREPVLLLESLLVGERWHGDERYGDHVSVESLVFEGTVYHLAVTDKTPLARPFRETGDLMPSTLDDDRQRVLRDAASTAINALGIRDGAVHTELKLTAEGPRVIEVNGRLGGPVATLLSLSAGYDVLADLGRIALGRPPLAAVRFHRYALFLTPVSPTRDVVVRDVRGVAEARALDGVESFTLRHPAGNRPDWRMGGFSSLWRAYVTSPTPEGLFELSDRLHKTVEVDLEDVA